MAVAAALLLQQLFRCVLFTVAAAVAVAAVAVAAAAAAVTVSVGVLFLFKADAGAAIGSETWRWWPMSRVESHAGVMPTGV